MELYIHFMAVTGLLLTHCDWGIVGRHLNLHFALTWASYIGISNIGFAAPLQDLVVLHTWPCAQLFVIHETTGRISQYMFKCTAGQTLARIHCRLSSQRPGLLDNPNHFQNLGSLRSNIKHWVLGLAIPLEGPVVLHPWLWRKPT